jgi:hypothetical protein
MKKFIPQIFSLFAGAIDTAVKHSFANISANFRKKIEIVLKGYSEARGKLIHENLKLKISYKTPFKYSTVHDVQYVCSYYGLAHAKNCGHGNG